jgi:hypothetical protein
LAGLGIGIEKTNAGIGMIPNFSLVPDYKNAGLCELCPVPDLFQYHYFFHSGTGLTGCRSVRHSGISINMNMDIDMGMQH